MRGSHITTRDESRDALAGVGFDCVPIDSEHAPLSPGEVQNLLMGFTGSKIVPTVRMAWNDFVLIKLKLDVGESGGVKQ